MLKRADIAFMMLVTYTSITNDDKARLLIYPFLSAVQPFLSLWCKPFLNAQAEILDFLELCLLSSRCGLFYAVSVVLLFSPDAVTTWLIAGFVIVLLVTVALYMAARILAQILRRAKEEQVESLRAPSAEDSSGTLHVLQKLRVLCCYAHREPAASPLSG